MTSVLHFRKQLVGPPVAPTVAKIRLRRLVAPDDVPAWLALRERAMADQAPRVRPWTNGDFHSAMTSKRWWTADCTWLATADDTTSIVGAVTLAVREGATAEVPVVHWILVDPAWRRRGIGRLLMSHLERSAWDAGWREVQIETHAGWTGAVAFYQSMGYAPVRERSAR